MEKRIVSIRLMAVLFLFALMCTGCVTQEMGNENWGNFQDANIAVKDFEPLGMIFTETQFQSNSNGTITGDIFTYQELLKKAQELNADAIINVVIDRKIENSTTKFAFVSNTKKKETWYGSALAIKYTETLTQYHQTVSAASYQNLVDFDSSSETTSDSPRRNSIWPWALGGLLSGFLLGGITAATL